MTILTAVAALLISIASFGFSIYQYRILHQVRVGEKVTALLRFAHDLIRRSQDLEHEIDVTDDVDDCSDFLASLNSFLEEGISKLITTRKMSLNELLVIEQRLLSLELELDLLYRKVGEVSKLNKEVHEYLTVRD